MAIPSHIRLEFVTPERALVQEDVDEVELPGEAGYFGVLPGHAPLLAALRPGEVWYRKGGERKFAFIGGGFAEVGGSRVSILAPAAERAEDIDKARAEAAKRRADDRLGSLAGDTDYDRARLALDRAVARLQVLSRQTIRS